MRELVPFRVEPLLSGGIGEGQRDTSRSPG
jgi:hypothetical protein